MDYYCVRNVPNQNGAYEVHSEACAAAPIIDERDYLGFLASGWDAVKKAKREFPKVVACRLCLVECYQN